MTDLEALLAAVKDHHADDTPRLVLADWLDEHGEGARAEFIRVQIELVRVKSQPGWVPGEELWHHDGATLQALFRLNNHDREKKIEELRCRERELLIHICCDIKPPWWVDLLRRFPRVNLGTSRFVGGDCAAELDRGFLSRIRCSFVDWIAHGDTILADPWTPGLDEVEPREWQFSGSAPWFSDPTPENAEVCLRIRWPDVRKWTLPPDGGFRVPEEFTPEMLRRLGLLDDIDQSAWRAYRLGVSPGAPSRPSSPDLT